MTINRKNEIIELVKSGREDEITEKEAKEFMEIATVADKKFVLDTIHDHQREKERKEEANNEFNIDFTRENKILSIMRIKNIINDKDNDESTKLNCLENFFNSFCLPVAPMEFKIKNLNKTIFKCHKCTIQIAKNQQYCHNCGTLIDWNNYEYTGYSL